MSDDPKVQFVFFDLETTGCPQSGSIFHPYHRIVQISAVCGDQTYDAIVNPECHIPSESTAIHRVTNEMALEQSNFGRIFPLFRTFVKKLSLRGTEIILVAHNAYGFDKLILEKECARFGLRVPATWKFYDTLVKYRTQFPELPSKKLGDIYKLRFKTDLDGAHNSLVDCLALKRLFECDLEPHFNILDTLPVNQQRYLSDDESVLKVRGIGRRTETKLATILGIINPTMGQLRARLTGVSYPDIELFIRTQLNCHKEQFVYSIICDIVQPEYPHLLFQSFPFLQHTFTIYLPPACLKTLMETHCVRSAEQLKRFYLFRMKESGEKWDKLIADLKVNPFHISMMMRSI